MMEEEILDLILWLTECYVFSSVAALPAILVSIISPLLKTLDTSFDFSERVLGMLSDLYRKRAGRGALRQFFNELSSTLESISSAVAVVLIIIVVFAAKFSFRFTAMPPPRRSSLPEG